MDWNKISAQEKQNQFQIYPNQTNKILNRSRKNIEFREKYIPLNKEWNMMKVIHLRNRNTLMKKTIMTMMMKMELINHTVVGKNPNILKNMIEKDKIILRF